MNMNKLMTTAAICIAVAELSAYAGDMKLWYRSEARDWVEALPVGNGRLGAMAESVDSLGNRENLDFGLCSPLLHFGV